MMGLPLPETLMIVFLVIGTCTGIGYEILKFYRLRKREKELARKEAIDNLVNEAHEIACPRIYIDKGIEQLEEYANANAPEDLK